MTKYNAVMVDIETTGCDSSKHAMIQLAARPFNLETFEIGETFFDKCLTVPENRGWDKGTIKWWQGDEHRRKIVQYIRDNREDYSSVMSEFKDFIYKECDGGKTELWCNHPFDWQFLENYDNQYNWKMPFRFWNVRELNSYIGGIIGATNGEEIKKSRPEIDAAGAHNAMFDVDWQIDWLFKVIKEKFDNV